MPTYRAAVIGCGRPGASPGVAEGYAIGYHHAKGYQATGRVQIVAAADVDAANLAAFAETFAVPATYRDYRQMLEVERPDVVSICTWPPLHPDMVVAAARAGAKGILCEKPMALGLGEADRMLTACRESGTVVCINHQRRLIPPWTTARGWLDAGRIGALVRMEAWVGGGWDLLSWGTHWVDMFFAFTGDQPARWVFAQIDCSQRRWRYGHPVEDRSLTMIGFDRDVTALLHIAPEAPRGAGMRLIGSAGQIDVRDGGQARLIGGEAGADLLEPRKDGFAAAVQELITSIESGRQPNLSGPHGRRATEVIMAAYASGIEQRLVTLPYEQPTFPLSALFSKAQTAGMS